MILPAIPLLQAPPGEPPLWAIWSMVIISLVTVLLALLSYRWWRRSQLALRARVADMTALREAGRVLAQLQLGNVDELCRLVDQQVAHFVDTSSFQLGLFEDGDYTIRFWRVRGQMQPPQRFNLKDDPGLIGWLRDHPQPILIRDFPGEMERLPARPRYVSEEPPRSAIFVPLEARDQVIGVIAVQSDRKNAFTERDARLLAVLASQAAISLQNTRLFRQIEDQATQVELVHRVGQQVAALMHLDELFDQVVHLIQQTYGYYVVNLFLIDSHTGDLVLEASTATYGSVQPSRLQLGQGIVGSVAQTAEPLMVNDVRLEPRYLFSEALSQTRAELAEPLILEDRVIGVLDVQSTQVGSFSERDVLMLRTLADQLAIAVQEYRWYRAARSRARQLAAIAQVTRAIVSILDLNELLEQVVQLVSANFHYPHIGIFLVDEASRTLSFRAGLAHGKAVDRPEAHHIRLDGAGLIATVARTGQAMVVPDVRLERRYIVGVGQEDSRSEMLAPLRVGGRILGVFDAQSPALEAFDDEDLEVFQTLSDAVAVAVRNASLYASERLRRQTAEALREASTAITTTLELDAVLDRILDGLARVVSYDGAAVLLVTEEDQVRIEAARGLPAQKGLVGRSLRVADSARLQRLTEEGHPVLFSETDAYGAYHTLLDLRGPHSCLGAPLMARGQLIGYLVVDVVDPKKYQTDDAGVIEVFAGQAAVAIDNAQLYTAQREDAWISTALLQVAEATGQSASLDDVLATVTRITPMLVGVDRCGVLLWQPGPDVFYGMYAYRSDSGWVEDFDQVRLSPQEWPALAQLQSERKPVTVQIPVLSENASKIPALAAEAPQGATVDLADLDTLSGLAGKPLAEMLDVPALLLLPLLTKNQVLGAMLVGYTDPGSFSTRRIELISGIANQAALAISGAQLYQAQQEEVYVSSALLQVAELVSSPLDLESILDTIVRLTPMLAGVERAALMLREEPMSHRLSPLSSEDGRKGSEEDRLAGGPSFGLSHPAEFRSLRVRLDEFAFLTALREHGQPVSVGPDLEWDLPSHWAEILGTSSILALPLLARGELRGVMLVDRPAELPVPDPSVEGSGDRRLNIILGIAREAALAIENARLDRQLAGRERLERELEVARDIQASFLPDACPVVPGWEMCTWWQAARQVGGDFYDFIPLPDGRWGLVIADVSDKGVPAALFMALSRTLIRAVAAVDGRSPAHLLSRVNSLIASDARSDMFVTAFYALWDPAAGSVVYANAGHNPPILAHADARLERLTVHGIALGVIEEASYQEGQIDMQPGDLLLLYTDGITDALSPEGREFGMEGLEAALLAYHDEPVGQAMLAFQSTLERWVGSAEPFDDVTVMMLKRKVESSAG